MHDNLNWDHLDDMVDAYASAYAYSDRLPVLETKIAQHCALMRSTPTMIEDFSSFLDTGFALKEAMTRKIAWASQHILKARAWCVAQKIMLRGNGWESPLVEQVTKLGLAATTIDLNSYQPPRKGKTITKVDAILVDIGQNTIYVVKGCSYSRANKASGNRILLGGSTNHLFVPADRIMARLWVPSPSVRALVLASNILRKSFLTTKVRSLFLVLDDIECGWKFQCHDLTDQNFEITNESGCCLDDFPIHSTSSNYAQVLTEDPDAFARMPPLPGPNFLYAAPVDRPTRALMILDELLRHQEAHPDRLVVLKASRLAEKVCQRHSIAYPDDLRRHDLEDCLRAGGFIRRPSFKNNSFGMTPKGVARMMMLHQKSNAMISHSPELILERIRTQAEHWLRARGDALL